VDGAVRPLPWRPRGSPDRPRRPRPSARTLATRPRLDGVCSEKLLVVGCERGAIVGAPLVFTRRLLERLLSRVLERDDPRMDATVMRGSLITLGCACVLAFHAHSSQFPVPTVLEPSPGASNCTYSLLAAFVHYVAARAPFVRYTLGSGTLLGAMRNAPPGLLQWEHDIDLYVPARDAFTLLDALRHECSGVNADHRWMRCVDHVCLPRPIITPLPSQGLRCSGIARSGQSRGRCTGCSTWTVSPPPPLLSLLQAVPFTSPPTPFARAILPLFSPFSSPLLSCAS
jgi:hypothetical protein